MVPLDVKRTETIALRLSERERRILETQAEMSGADNFSAWARESLLGHVHSSARSPYWFYNQEDLVLTRMEAGGDLYLSDGRACMVLDDHLRAAITTDDLQGYLDDQLLKRFAGLGISRRGDASETIRPMESYLGGFLRPLNERRPMRLTKLDGCTAMIKPPGFDRAVVVFAEQGSDQTVVLAYKYVRLFETVYPGPLCFEFDGRTMIVSKADGGMAGFIMPVTY